MENITDFEESDIVEVETSDKDSRTKQKPDFRIVQTDKDKDGNTRYNNVGAMWKNISKAGNEFYTLKIGNLRLLVFRND